MKKPILIIISALFLAANISVAQQEDGLRKKNELLLLRARNFEQIGRYDLSLDVYLQLWNSSLTNINYYRGVLNNLLRLSRFEEAEKVVKKMLQYTTSELVQSDLGDVYYKMGRKDEAFAVWDELLQSKKSRQSVYQIVAMTMQRNGLFDRAIEVYRLGQKQLKNKRLFLIDIANLYRSQRDYLKAARQYLLYLEAFPNQYSFVESNIISLASNADYADEIVKILQERVKKNPENVQLRQLLAAAYFRNADYGAALNEYTIIDEYILKQSKTQKSLLGRELYRFAMNAFNDGAYEFALQGYQLLIKRYPNSSYTVNAKMGVGQCLRRLKRYSDAITHYKLLAQEKKGTVFEKNSYFRIGEIELLDLSDPVAAEKSFRKVLQLKPTTSLNTQALFRIGDCFVQKDELEKGLNWYSKILQQSGLNEVERTRAKFYLGLLNFWLGRFEAAQKIFQNIIDKPIFVPQKNEGAFVNDAIDYILLIQENVAKKEMLAKFALAELKTRQKKDEQAIEILKDILIAGEENNLKDRVLVKLGEIHLKNKKYASALSDFQRLLEEVPESMFADYAQKRIGDVYNQGFHDFPSAVKAYELVLVNYPDSIYLEEVREKIRLLEKKHLN